MQLGKTYRNLYQLASVVAFCLMIKVAVSCITLRLKANLIAVTKKFCLKYFKKI